MKAGDRIICINGCGCCLEEGRTYTFRMYFGKDYLIVEEEKDMRWLTSRFIVSNKGNI